MAKSAGRDNEPPGPITRGPKAWQLAQGCVHSPWPPAHELLATLELAQEPLPLAQPRRERWSRPVCAAPARLALGSPPSQDAASRGDAGASSPRPSSPTGFTVLLEGGTWSDQAQEPSIGSAAEESRYLQAPHCIPTDPGPTARGFCCSRSRTKAESRLQKSAWAQQAGTNSCTWGRTAVFQSSGSAAVPEDFAEAPDTSATPQRVRDTSLHYNFGMTSSNFTNLEEAKRFGLRHCHKGCSLSHSGRAERTDPTTPCIHCPELLLTGDSRATAGAELCQLGSSQPACTARDPSLPGAS